MTEPLVLEICGYVGVVEDENYPSHSHDSRKDGFETAEAAAEWAEAKAKSHGYTGIHWWVEYDVDVVTGHCGIT